METLYDVKAPKKATNLSINSDLLQRARAMEINLSQTLERALNDKLAQEKAEHWKSENKAAIRAYNEFIEKHGCFGDEHRLF